MTIRHVSMAGLVVFGALLACGKPKAPSSAPDAAVASPASAVPTVVASAGAPAACVASPPVTLRPGIPNGSAPVSVALGSDTVWVLYAGKAGTTEAPVLLEVLDFDLATPRITEHALPAGSIGGSSALAVAQHGIVGTYVGAKGVVFFSMTKTEPDVFTVPAGAITTGGSLAVVGAKALTAFGQDDDGVHTAWFDVATGARQGTFEKIGGKVQQPSVAGAFGGLTVFSDFSHPGPGVLRARGASGEPFALPAVGSDNGNAAAASGVDDRAYVLYDVIGPATPGAMFPKNTIKLATLTDAKGNGSTVELGTAGMVPETALQATSWGAVGAFLDARNALQVATVDRSGHVVMAPMLVTSPGERARRPSVAVAGSVAVTVWNRSGAAPELRMSVLHCK